ncbi:MAG: hypothetical protein ACKO2P_14300 [Planctomycetota bacterium]
MSLHILSSGLWLGAASAMVVVMWLRPVAPQTAAELMAWCLAVKLIDDVVVIGSAAGSLLTGLLLSWRTRWGFFVWYWVGFKLIATVLMVLFGATCLGPWIDRTAAVVGRSGLHAMEDPAFLGDTRRAAVFGAAQAGLLAFVVCVSVFKPWGRVASPQRGDKRTEQGSAADTGK